MSGLRSSAPSQPAKHLVAAAGLASCLVPRAAHACAACYGASDSPLAAGMNWGIMVLLGMIVGVLGGIATCFFVLARRSQKVPRPEAEAALLARAQASWPVVADTDSSAIAPPLSERGGLKTGSTLIQRRKNCAGRPATGRTAQPPGRV